MACGVVSWAAQVNGSKQISQVDKGWTMSISSLATSKQCCKAGCRGQEKAEGTLALEVRVPIAGQAVPIWAVSRLSDECDTLVTLPPSRATTGRVAECLANDEEVSERYSALCAGQMRAEYG